MYRTAPMEQSPRGLFPCVQGTIRDVSGVRTRSSVLAQGLAPRSHALIQLCVRGLAFHVSGHGLEPTASSPQALLNSLVRMGELMRTSRGPLPSDQVAGMIQGESPCFFRRSRRRTAMTTVHRQPSVRRPFHRSGPCRAKRCNVRPCWDTSVRSDRTSLCSQVVLTGEAAAGPTRYGPTLHRGGQFRRARRR
jgi:hypothetical protein